MKALDKQHGGDHYKNKAMQPVELWAALNLNGFQASIVKYITRHKEKNGAEDIDKAEHFFDLMIELGQSSQSFGLRDHEVELVRGYSKENEFSEGEAEAVEATCLLDTLDDLSLVGYSTGFEDRFRDALVAIRDENGYPVK